jgi:putative ABC transport system permease protein
MRHILLLALYYLRFHRIKSLILVFSVAAVIFLPLTVNWLVRDYQRDLLARAQATPLVAGAAGSRLDLVLHALYFRGKPAHDLTMGEVEKMNGSGLALAIPIVEKDSARGVPIVGTTLEYLDFRGLRVARGAGLTRLGDCLLGAAAAEKLKLQPGERLMSDPQNVFDLAGSYPLNMRVKGILAPAGTADDDAVFVDVKTEWLILGIVHGHQEAESVDPSLLLSRSASNVTASAALLPFQEVTETNLSLFHLHGDGASCPVSAILAVPRDEKSAAILRGRYQDPKSPAQLLVPRTVVADTLDIIFRVKRFFDAQALLVGTAMALLLTLVVLLSLRLRQGEMETMSKLGCARRTIFCLVAAELGVVGAVGAAIAVGSSWLLVAHFGLATSRAEVRRPEPPVLPSTNARKRVAVVNYPLEYFAHRIAGDHVDISFPVPRQEDPAFWKPSDQEIESLQRADLVLLNGAEYEKWLPAAVLPLTRQIVTSQVFADSYVTNGEVLTHSHGPQGMHSHGQIDFNTWMDPKQAARQAQSVRDELVRLVPAATKDLDANLRALVQDLDKVDVAIQQASSPLGHSPLLGSHPVYEYAARRYGWNLRSVHWEPDELPSDEEWRRFEELHRQHPARIMIWEADPLPAVAERLRQMGIEPICFETCANQPAQGDYLTAMKANAARLATATKLQDHSESPSRW